MTNSKIGKNTIKIRTRRSFLKTSFQWFAFALLAFKAKLSMALTKKKLVDEDVFATDVDKNSNAAQSNENSSAFFRGFRGGERGVYDGGVLTLLGRPPQGLNGYLLRNGSGGIASRIREVNTLLEGEPLVQAIRMKNRSIGHYGRVVQTESYRKEMEAGKALFARKNTPPPTAKAAYYQPQNMNVLPLQNIVYLLADNSYPIAVDRESLTLSEGVFQLEKLKQNSDKKRIEDFRFGSHPIQTDRGIWNAIPVWEKQPGIQLTRFTQAGSLAAEAFHPLKQVGYFHSFLLTDTRLVVVMPPYWRVNAGEEGEIESKNWHWQPDKPTRIFVFKIDTLELLEEIAFAKEEFPPLYCEHYSNAYDDGETIVFDGFAYESPLAIQQQHEAIARNQWMPTSPKHMQFTLSLKPNEKKIQAKILGKNHYYEMPSIDPRQRGKKHTMVVALKRTAKDVLRGGYAHYRRVVVRNPKNGRETGYKFFNSSEIVEEHIYIPDKRKKSGRGGWIVGTCYDFRINRTVLNVFAKDKISEGPLLRTYLPYGVPIASHGAFLPDF